MRQYEMCELSYQTGKPKGSEVQIDLQGEFKREGSPDMLRVKGFYAGDGICKVRFLPSHAGSYRYKITGLVEDEGTILVKPAKEGCHGIVRAAGTHLQHEDGTWFYSFGTTVYALAHQDEALTEETMQTLEKSPFNKIRMCTFPKHYVYNANDPKCYAFYRKEDGSKISFCDNLGSKRVVAPFDPARPCYAFWDDFERKLERLFSMGIQVDLILFHPYDRWGHSHMPLKDNLLYLDYALRRLSAYPGIWWSLANEYDLLFDWKLEDWYAVEEFIAKNDPYHHLLSNHNCIRLYDFERENVTHVSLQHRTMTLTDHLIAQYEKPVLYDECCYEGNLKEDWGSISGKEMVNRFWKVTTPGGYCTHGEVILDADNEDPDAAVLWWAKGGKLKGTSTERIAFLRNVIESLPGPLSPYVTGFGDIMYIPDDTFAKIIAGAPEGIGDILRLMSGLPYYEKVFKSVNEHSFAGRVGNQAFLFYYGENCFGRMIPQLPAEQTYKLEVIDAWNMTRETIATGYHPGKEVILPGREYIALLATAE